MSEKMTALEAEQQALNAQIAALEAAQADSAANTPMAWWVTALIAAIATALLFLAVVAVAMRRGALPRIFKPEPRHAR